MESTEHFPQFLEERELGWLYTLSNGKELYTPHWSPLKALGNLSLLSKVFTAELLYEISQGTSLKPVLVAFANASDPKAVEGAIKVVLSTAVIDGQRLDREEVYADIFLKNLNLVSEVFSAIIQTQYKDFFEQGIAEDNSQPH